MKNNPYLTLRKNCEEAMVYYKEIFGGELTIMKVKDTPVASDFPAEAQEKVMHSELVNGDFKIMAAGISAPGFENTVPETSVNVFCDNEDQINKLYNYFSKEGKVTCPIGPSFWGTTFACVTDKYDVSWLLNCDLK